ncbi:hypothetical protein Btru_007475 [Bulinus truncatus]|nr:hypothetical protein Btru_007475 [Bulinus truncatus]
MVVPFLHSHRISNPIITVTPDHISNPLITDTPDHVGKPIITVTPDHVSKPIITVTPDHVGKPIITVTPDHVSKPIITVTPDHVSKPIITVTPEHVGKPIITVRPVLPTKITNEKNCEPTNLCCQLKAMRGDAENIVIASVVADGRQDNEEHDEREESIANGVGQKVADDPNDRTDVSLQEVNKEKPIVTNEENDAKLNPSNDETREEKVDLSCGIWKFRTNLLGSCYSNLYLFATLLTSIEKQFNIDNSRAGLFDVVARAGYLSTILFAGHFAKKANIPVIIGLSGVFQGFLLTTPAFLQLANPYKLPILTPAGHSNVSNTTNFGDNAKYMCDFAGGNETKHKTENLEPVSPKDHFVVWCVSDKVILTCVVSATRSFCRVLCQRQGHFVVCCVSDKVILSCVVSASSIPLHYFITSFHFFITSFHLFITPFHSIPLLHYITSLHYQDCITPLTELTLGRDIFLNLNKSGTIVKHEVFTKILEPARFNFTFEPSHFNFTVEDAHLNFTFEPAYLNFTVEHVYFNFTVEHVYFNFTVEPAHFNFTVEAVHLNFTFEPAHFTVEYVYFNFSVEYVYFNFTVEPAHFDFTGISLNCKHCFKPRTLFYPRTSKALGYTYGQY